ncbi:MAG: cytochrome P450 [Bryobacterales bacterium]|nr:cytochrome P450 [Bryobacterales bacterium]
MRRPHGPRNPVVVGHLPAFRRNPLEFLTWVGAEYPDLCYFKLGNQHLYFVNHPELIKDVLVTQLIKISSVSRRFSPHEQNSALRRENG